MHAHCDIIRVLDDSAASHMIAQAISKEVVHVQVRAIVSNSDKKHVDAHGHPLPPCIVMERGEPLDIWARRARPDRPMAFTVRSHDSHFAAD
jgi:hypothetical protein